jgi:hypothetical protein
MTSGYKINRRWSMRRKEALNTAKDVESGAVSDEIRRRCEPSQDHGREYTESFEMSDV